MQSSCYLCKHARFKRLCYGVAGVWCGVSKDFIAGTKFNCENLERNNIMKKAETFDSEISFPVKVTIYEQPPIVWQKTIGNRSAKIQKISPTFYSVEILSGKETCGAFAAQNLSAAIKLAEQIMATGQEQKPDLLEQKRGDLESYLL